MSQTPVGPSANPRPGGDGLSKGSSIVLAIFSVEVAVLVVTGVALFFAYRPVAQLSWGDLVTEVYRWNVRVASGLRLAHRLASSLAVPTALAAGLVLALADRRGVRRWPGAALGVGVIVTTLVASYTGFLPPWDQLALWAVTVGENLAGYGPLFKPTVRFVIAGGAEIDPDTVVRWLLVHALVLGPALVGLILLGWRRNRVGAVVTVQ